MDPFAFRKKLFALSLQCILLLLSATCVWAQSSEGEAELETVEVTAANRQLELEQQEVDKTPGGVNLVDMELVREGNVANLADMLRYVPGVWSTSATGSDNIVLTSRGSNLDATDYDMNGIKLLQDGLSVTAADGNNHNRIIDPLSARYAVFARGANGQKYGASTLGGAVNFISPNGRDSAPLALSLNGGSHGLIQARATLAGGDESLDGIVTLENKEWRGYREHNEQSRRGVYAMLGAQLRSGISTRFYATSLQNDQELSGALSSAEMRADAGQANPKAVSGNFQFNVDTLRLANTTNWQIDDNRSLEWGLSFEDQNLYHPIVDKVIVPINGVPTEVFSLLIDTQQRDWGSMLRYQQRSGNHDWLLGLNYGDNSVRGGNYRNDAGARNGRTADIDHSANSLEVFAEDRWQLDKQWMLIAGAQFVSAAREVRETTLSSGALRNPRADYSVVNPRLGVIYQLSEGNSLFANLSSLYEAPTNFQLEDEGSASDKTLDAMHGRVLEVGSRGGQTFADASWNWDLSLYAAQIRDEILSLDDPAAPGTSLSANIDRTLHAGLEALVSANFSVGEGGSIAPLLSLSINHFRFDDDSVYGDNQLPAAPDYALKAELLYRHSNGFYFGPTLDFVGERYADFSNLYTVDSYSIWGLRAGMATAKWRIFAEVKNLADREYVASHSVRDSLSESADASAAILNPGEPLSVYAGVEWQF